MKVGEQLYSLGETRFKSKLQESNPRLASNKFNMAQSTSTLQSHPPCPGHPLRPNLGLNVSRGPRPATGHRKTNQPERKWKPTQDEEIQKGKELRVQNWAKRRECRDELSALNPGVLKALDMKECVLEVQATLMGTLAAEENHIKGLVEAPEPSTSRSSCCVPIGPTRAATSTRTSRLIVAFWTLSRCSQS